MGITGVQVDFEGPYPIEGAKEVGTLMTRYVSRALRPWSGQLGSPPASMKAAITGVANKMKKVVRRGENATAAKQKALKPALPHLHLSTGSDHRGVQQVVVQDIGRSPSA